MNVSTMTVGEAIASIRDISFVIGLTVIGWKARSWLQPVYDFIQRANKHMGLVEAGMQTLLTNHLKHMEQDLRTIANRDVVSLKSVGPIPVIQTQPVEVIQSREKPIWVVQIDPNDLMNLQPPIQLPKDS